MLKINLEDSKKGREAREALNLLVIYLEMRVEVNMMNIVLWERLGQDLGMELALSLRGVTLSTNMALGTTATLIATSQTMKISIQ